MPSSVGHQWVHGAKVEMDTSPCLSSQSPAVWQKVEGKSMALAMAKPEHYCRSPESWAVVLESGEIQSRVSRRQAPKIPIVHSCYKGGTQLSLGRELKFAGQQ